MPPGNIIRDRVGVPFTRGAAVSKSDATVLSAMRGLWVGTGGDLTLTGDDDADFVLVNVPDGTLLEGSPKKVKAATTAADLVALR